MLDYVDFTEEKEFLGTPLILTGIKNVAALGLGNPVFFQYHSLLHIGVDGRGRAMDRFASSVYKVWKFYLHSRSILVINAIITLFNSSPIYIKLYISSLSFI